MKIFETAGVLTFALVFAVGAAAADQPYAGQQTRGIKTLSDQASEAFDENLTKAEASRRIDELQERTGRGQS